MSDHVDIDGVLLHLSKPDTTESPWIGQAEVLKQVLACWLVVDAADQPLTPRLIGTPESARPRSRSRRPAAAAIGLHLSMHCRYPSRGSAGNSVLGEKGTIQYHASSLVTAMITGGVCILDEGNRMNEKSWASLAPLLDHRRYVESIVAGITIKASPHFRCAVTMNDDESTFEIPDYILSRLQPTLTLGFPSREDELAILKYHLPFAQAELLNLTVEFLQQSHDLKLDFSTRDGLNVLRYALKRIVQDQDHPLARDDVWREALESCLGQDAIDLESLARRKNQALGGNILPMGLGDFFFNPEDPLHPDYEGEDDDEDFEDDDYDDLDSEHES
ncbi:MAG: AAA family ATPase [Planctomycetaceae bacterium]